MLKKSFLFVLILEFFSCSEKKHESLFDLPQKIDTIYSPNKSVEEICKFESEGYYEKYGLVISKFYKFSNSYKFDYNSNGINDSLVILRPFYFNDNDLENSCKIDNNNNNNNNNNNMILLICEINNSKISKTFQYKNILSNESSSLGKEVIKIKGNHFSISGDWGHSNKFYSDILIGYDKNDFFVDNIHISSEGLYQYDRNYSFKIKLNDFKRKTLDSLRELNENSSTTSN